MEAASILRSNRILRQRISRFLRSIKENVLQMNLKHHPRSALLQNTLSVLFLSKTSSNKRTVNINLVWAQSQDVQMIITLI